MREAALAVWKKALKGKKRPEGWNEILTLFVNNLPTDKPKDVVASKVSGFFFVVLIQKDSVNLADVRFASCSGTAYFNHDMEGFFAEGM
jgi:hypothetical protein